jgi:hypothetical protein
MVSFDLQERTKSIVDVDLVGMWKEFVNEGAMIQSGFGSVTCGLVVEDNYCIKCPTLTTIMATDEHRNEWSDRIGLPSSTLLAMIRPSYSGQDLFEQTLLHDKVRKQP